MSPKVMDFLLRARANMLQADMTFLPDTPGRDEVCPPLHVAMTYLDAAILAAEDELISSSPERTRRALAAAGVEP